MARKETLFRRWELFIAAAAIGAHASAQAEGFRQRDIRFLIELFTNWVEQTISDRMLPLNNVQVQRYLADLVQEGFARKVSRTGQPRYRLTRIGILEMLSRMTSRSSRQSAEHFFCLYYFLYNYKPRIEALIREEGKQFPLALRIEIETLLDYRRILKEEILETEREIQKLTARHDDAQRASRLAAKMFEQQSEMSDVVQELERRYPYELNSEKPLSDLFAELPRDIGRWELVEGNLHRAEQIWAPAKALHEGYLRVLKEIERGQGC